MKKLLILLLVGISLIGFSFGQSKPKIDGILSPNEYKNYASFSNGEYKIFWSIIDDGVYILITALTKGWIALGINPGVKAGEADYILGYVKDKEVKVVDYWAPAKHVDHVPDVKLGGKDDILEYAGVESGNYTTIEFRRKLVTGDKYDKEFPKTGTLKIVWALGPSDDLSTKHFKAGYGELKY
ncbi:MAG: dopamine beta hydroxylase [Dictyoglomus sp. NZ13-RE01]|nr:MAG: dopamine beta hydroxylase [Dictyoglomus sp. NZ13-RE01]